MVVEQPALQRLGIVCPYLVFQYVRSFVFFFCRCSFYRFYHHPYLRHYFFTMPKYHSFRVDHRDKVRLTRCQTKSFFYSWIRHTSSECNHLPADIASIISDYTRYFDNLCSLFLWCFRLIFLRYLALFCGRSYFSSFQLLRLCSVCIPYFLYLHFFLTPLTALALESISNTRKKNLIKLEWCWKVWNQGSV